jgi:hypothetical protein
LIAALKPSSGSYLTTFDYDEWASCLGELGRQYRSASPFPHIVIDHMFHRPVLDRIVEDASHFESDNWINYSHVNERKRGFNRFDELPGSIQHLISELNSDAFCDFLSDLTGIPGLVSDESLEGGGLHETREGGFLNIHADFVSHPHRANWRRRVNVIVFLNDYWEDDWNGSLELWSPDMEHCAERISPLINRCVIFNTDDTSYHGHPDPLLCPDGVVRRSIALYYFTAEEQPLSVRSTHYRARPQDARKRWLIELDNAAIKAYTLFKRRFDTGDIGLSRLLRFLSGR